jgi:hypothetical protein
MEDENTMGKVDTKEAVSLIKSNKVYYNLTHTI